MIANLITTLLLAIGVATGNVSSNSYKGGNAFNHVEKKPIQKAIEEQIYLQSTGQTKQQAITYTTGFITNAEAQKWYRGTNTSTPNINTQYLNIRSSIYTCVDATTNATVLTVCEVMQIDNYTDTSLNQINVKYQAWANGAVMSQDDRYDTYNVIKRYNNGQLTNEIDKTITGYQSVIDIRNTIINTTADELLVDYSQQKNSLQWYSTDIDFTINYLPAHSNIQLGIYVRFRYYQPNYNNVVIRYSPMTSQPDLTIKGTPLVGDINYEVVNVPELMFTIITLPFAFYSTAFNLTIFPGTPYALNFGNLILTILAALILLYLIKKVLK